MAQSCSSNRPPAFLAARQLSLNRSTEWARRLCSRFVRHKLGAVGVGPASARASDSVLPRGTADRAGAARPSSSRALLARQTSHVPAFGRRSTFARFAGLSSATTGALRRDTPEEPPASFDNRPAGPGMGPEPPLDPCPSGRVCLAARESIRPEKSDWMFISGRAATGGMTRKPIYGGGK